MLIKWLVLKSIKVISKYVLIFFGSDLKLWYRKYFAILVVTVPDEKTLVFVGFKEARKTQRQFHFEIRCRRLVTRINII